MLVSAASQNSNKLYNSATTAQQQLGSSGAIQALEKQKSQLQEQISKLNEQKLDPKEKLEKQKEIQDQINQIDAQINEVRAEEKEEQIEKAKEKSEEEKINNADTDEEQEQQVKNANIKDLFEAANGVSDLKTLNHIRVKVKGEIAVGEGEMKADASRGKSASSYTAVQVGEGNATLDRINRKMAKKIEYIDKKVEQARDAGIKEAEIEREKKNDTKTDQINGKAANENASDNAGNVEQINTDQPVQTNQDDTKKVDIKTNDKSENTPEDNKPNNDKNSHKHVDVKI